MITLIGGEKGGTGKTTLAVNLACLAAADGADLVFVDTDPQRSAALFFTQRHESGQEPRIPCVEKRGKTLGRELQDLNKRYDLVIVDAGGRDSMELRYAVAVADEVYTPIQPAQADLWTLDKMSELLDQAWAFNPDLKAYVILNRCSTNVRVTDPQEARAFLGEFAEYFSPLGTEIKDRVAYRRIFGLGSSVVEYDAKDAAAREMQALYREIFY